MDEQSDLARDSSRPMSGFFDGLRLLPGSIWLPLLAISLLGIGVFVFNEWSVRQVRLATDSITRQLSMQRDLIDMRAQLGDAESAQRGYLLSRNRAYLPPYERAVENLPLISSRLYDAARGDAELVARLNQIEQLRGRKMQELGTTVQMTAQGSRDEALVAMRTGEGRRLMEDLRDRIDEVLTGVDARLIRLQREQGRNVVMSRFAFAILAVLTLLLLVLVVRLFVDETLRREHLRYVEEHERRRLEAIVAERTQELSDLSTHLQNLSEQEKADLARDLHDELGGLLTAAKMDLAWLQGRTATLDDEYRTKLADLAAGLTEAMNLKRRVVENLRPALLDHFGLPTALQAYFDETCRKAGLGCNAVIPDDFEHIPQELAIALFRVGQESLINIVRHAKAKNVDLTFEVERDRYCVRIRDDGMGMDLATMKVSHGMRGMRHRVESLRGTFDVESAPGGGTQISISVPRRPSGPVTAANVA